MGAIQFKGSTSVCKDDEYTFQPFKLKSNLQFHISKQDSSCNGFQLSCSTPTPRSGHRVVCDDINMYSFGGYNPALTSSDEADLATDPVWPDSKPLFKELWKYNLSTSLWVKPDVRDIPDILASNAVHLSGHLLMVYGGTGVPFGANCSNDLYICDLKSTLEEHKFNLVSATGNRPVPQYGQAIVTIKHYLYSIGGTTGYEYTSDIHRLNLKNNVWDSVYTCTGSDNEPPGRYRHEVAFYDNRIFVLGGGTASVSYDFQVIFTFNLETNEWEKKIVIPDDRIREAYPAARRCHSCVQHEQYVYIIGGFNGQVVFKDIWRLDLHTFKWTKLENLSFDRGLYFHSSCMTSYGKMFTFGGIVKVNNTSKRSAEVHSAWLCIPKLKEICWEAIIFYSRDLNSLSENHLYSSGLPNEFIKRLSFSDLNKVKRLGLKIVQAKGGVLRRRGSRRFSK